MSGCTTCSCSQFMQHPFKPTQCSQCFHARAQHSNNKTTASTGPTKQTSPPPLPTHNSHDNTTSSSPAKHSNGGTAHTHDTTTDSTHHNTTKYTALYDYAAQDQRQLSFSEQDVLYPAQYDRDDGPDDWVYVQHSTTHQTGWAPLNYLQYDKTSNVSDKVNSVDTVDSVNTSAIDELVKETENDSHVSLDLPSTHTAAADAEQHNDSVASKVGETIVNALSAVLPASISSMIIDTTTTEKADDSECAVTQHDDSVSDAAKANLLSGAAIGSSYGADDIVDPVAVQQSKPVPFTVTDIKPDAVNVSTSAQPSPAATAPSTPTSQRQVKTLYPFSAQHDSQLSFTAGQIFTVVNSQHDGWLAVVDQSNKLIPANYITDYDAEAEHAKQSAVKLKQHKLQSIKYAIEHNEPVKSAKCIRALYDFAGQYTEQLTIKQGDILYVVDASSVKGWLHAVKKSDKTDGLVAENYVEDYTEPKPVAVEPEKPIVNNVTPQKSINATPAQTSTSAALYTTSTTPKNAMVNVTSTTPMSALSTPRSESRDEYDDMSIAGFASAPAQQTTSSAHTTPVKQAQQQTPMSSTTTTPKQPAVVAPPPARPPIKDLKQMKAMHTFNAIDDEQLSFQQFDVLYIIEESDDGWWLAKHSGNNAQGYVPANYLTLYTPPAPPQQTSRPTTPQHSRENSLFNYVTQSSPNSVSRMAGLPAQQQQSTPAQTAQQTSTPALSSVANVKRNVQPIAPYQAICIRSYKATAADECSVDLGTLVKVNGLDSGSQFVRINDIINDVAGMIPLKHTARVLSKHRANVDCYINPADVNAKQYLSFIRGDRLTLIGKKSEQIGIGFLHGKIGLFNFNATQEV